MKIISGSFQSMPGNVTDVLMNKGYVENEYDNINFVKFKPWSIFSVSEYNQKNARSSSKRFIREEDQCGGKKTGGALDLISYTLQCELVTHHYSRKCRTRAHV